MPWSNGDLLTPSNLNHKYGSGVFSPYAYGAVGNGTTDDTVAVQACLDAAGTDLVFFPTGTFLCGQLSLNTGQRILLSPAATIKAKPNIGATLLSVALGSTDVAIEGGILDGDKTNQASTFAMVGLRSKCSVRNVVFKNGHGYGIQVGQADVADCVVDGNRFEDFTGDLFVVAFQNGASRCRITNNILSEITAGGIQVHQPAGSIDNYDITISNNTLRNVAEIAIECQYFERASICGNVISGTGLKGVSLGTGSYISVTGNTIKDQTQEGIEVAGGTGNNIVISGNSIENCGAGIGQTATRSEMTITGNTIRNTTDTSVGHGIRSINLKNSTISGNTFLDTYKASIRLLASGNTVDDVLVQGNTFIFDATRNSAPCGVEVGSGSSNRVTIRNNKFKVGAEYATVTNQGPVVLSGTMVDVVVTDNDMIATTGSAAQNSAIRVQASATIAGAKISRNRIKNFLHGIHTSSDAGSSNVEIVDNEVDSCTTAYTQDPEHMTLVRRRQSMAFSATIIPNNTLGEILEIGALTNNITISADSRPSYGARLTIVFTQDGTGGRTVTWNAVYLVNWTPDTAAGKVNTISFYYNGTNWVQTSTATGL